MIKVEICFYICNHGKAIEGQIFNKDYTAT